MSNDCKEHAKCLIASLGKDKAFEYAWGMKEYHRDMTSFWADVARCIDPVMYSQVCKEEEIERLKAENERLNAVALQAQSAAIDLAYKNGQLRKALMVCLAHWLSDDNPDELQGDVMKFKELCDW